MDDHIIIIAPLHGTEPADQSPDPSPQSGRPHLGLDHGHMAEMFKFSCIKIRPLMGAKINWWADRGMSLPVIRWAGWPEFDPRVERISIVFEENPPKLPLIYAVPQASAISHWFGYII